jgi:hypothetical protein
VQPSKTSITLCLVAALTAVLAIGSPATSDPTTSDKESPHLHFPETQSIEPAIKNVDQGKIVLPVLTTEELYDLQRLKLRSEIQAELVEWAQVRFWFIAIAALLIGFFGVRSFVRELISSELRSATEASVEAQIVTEQGRKAISDLKSQTDQYELGVSELRRVADSTVFEFEAFQNTISAESIRSRQTSELQLDALKEQVTELGTIVETLSDDADKTKKEYTVSIEKFRALKIEADTAMAHFRANTNLKIGICFRSGDKEGAQESRVIMSALTKLLAKEGYEIVHSVWSEETPSRDFINIDWASGNENLARRIKEVVMNGLDTAGKSQIPVTVSDLANDHKFRETLVSIYLR